MEILTFNLAGREKQMLIYACGQRIKWRLQAFGLMNLL